MGNLIDFFIDCFRNYNIYFLGILIVLKFTGIPTGSSILVIAAGAFARAGEFNIISLLIEIWFFSCIGDFIGYFLWKFIGDIILSNFLKIRKYFEPRIQKSEEYLNKYGKPVIFYSRFLLSAIAPFVNAACGISRYKFSAFSIYAILGNFLWTIIYLGLGYYFSDYWVVLIPLVTSGGEFLTFITIIIVIIYWILKRVKRNN